MAKTEAQMEAFARARAKRAENIAARKRGEHIPTPQEMTFVSELPEDDSAPPKAPKDTAPKQTSKGGRPPGYSPKTASLTKIRQGLVMMFTAAGMAVSMVDTYDGKVVAVNAERLADAWVQVAEQNARVRKVLEAMLEGSAIGNAFMTTAMVLVPIAVHHGAAGDTLNDMAKTMGVEVPPDDTPSQPLRRPPERTTRPAPVPPTGAGSPVANGTRNGDVGDVSYEDAIFPHNGPPDRAA